LKLQNGARPDFRAGFLILSGRCDGRTNALMQL
jgi:hypothetical protein